MNDITINGINYINYPYPENDIETSNIKKDISDEIKQIMLSALAMQPRDLYQYQTNVELIRFCESKYSTNCSYGELTENTINKLPYPK